MSFEKFLELVRKRIGNYCTDEYWRTIYESKKIASRSKHWIDKEIPFMAIHAVATDYSTKNG